MFKEKYVLNIFQYKSSRKSSSGNENDEVRKEGNIINYLKYLLLICS